MRYTTWRKFILPFALMVCALIYVTGTIGCSSSNEEIVSNFKGNFTGTGNTNGSLDIITTEALAAAPSFFAIKEAWAQATASVTGSILVGGNTITVDTGSLNVDTGAIEFNAGDYTFTGTLTDGVIVGTWLNNNTGDTGVWSALDSTTVTVISYCGTYTSTTPAPGADSGIIAFQVSSGGKAAGTFTSTAHPDLVNIPFTGTVTNGTDLALNGSTANSTGSATSTIDTNTGTANGTWQVNVTAPPTEFTGTFETSTGSCP